MPAVGPFWWAGVVGDVLHDVEHESGLFVDFLCSFEWLLTALVVLTGSH